MAVIDVVSVFCRRDLRLQLLQATSIRRHFERSGFGRAVLVWNEPSAPPLGLREELAARFADHPFELRTASDFGVTPDEITLDGWMIQQALKLLAVRDVSAERYLVLDAKNHFVHPSSSSDFVATNGKAIAPLRNLAANPSYRYCLQYAGLPAVGAHDVGIANETPFTLHTGVVRDLVAALEEREELPLGRVFLAHQHKMSEFLIYQAHFLARGLVLNDLYESGSNLAETFWVTTARDARSFDRSMQQLESARAKVAGLHWIAARALDKDQRARLCTLWLGAQLIGSRAEGEQIMEWTIDQASEGDRRFLMAFESGGASRR